MEVQSGALTNQIHMEVKRQRPFTLQSAQPPPHHAMLFVFFPTEGLSLFLPGLSLFRHSEHINLGSSADPRETENP